MKMKVKTIKRLSGKKNELEREKEFFPKIYREISYYIAKPLMRFHPNIISIAAIIIGVLADILFIFNNNYILTLALIMTFLNVELDYVDGTVARIKKKTSLLGEFLDTVNHATVVNLMYITLGIREMIIRQNPFILIVGIVAALANLLSAVFRLQHNKLVKGVTTTKTKKKKPKVMKFKKILFFLDNQIEFLVLAAIIGRIDIYLYIIAISVILRTAGFFVVDYLNLSSLIKKSNK